MKGGKWYGETVAAVGCSSIYIDKIDYTLQLKKIKTWRSRQLTYQSRYDKLGGQDN
jgi:hypothetical protein